MLVSSPSLLWGMLGVVSPLSILCLWVGEGVYGETVTQPLLPNLHVFFFLICLMHRNCPVVFWISLGGNCSTNNCRSGVSEGGGEFRSLLCCILNLNLGEPYEVFVLNKTGLETCPFLRNR